MSTPFKLTRIASLKSPAAFLSHLSSLGLQLPCDESILTGPLSPLTQPILNSVINAKTIGNRFAIHPMEGWDATPTGQPTDPTFRRWERFGESGAKLIFGGEAMAVREDGRANPNQLVLNPANTKTIAQLRSTLLAAHQNSFNTTHDLVIGFQLTHSGRFCRPNDKKRLEPRVAFRHPLLDPKFGVTSDSQVLSDSEIQDLIQCYIRAARCALEAGADFVDLKHCHGYLLHEFLGAHTRPGPYGGCFENRTRILREIIEGIRADQNPIDIAVRLSAFDMVPFRPNPALSSPGKPGPGIPEDFSQHLPYSYGFGLNPLSPVEIDLLETHRFAHLCATLGVRILNLSAGSPYYNPHIQRPAAYPPSDGYQPDHDPLIDVVRQIHAVRDIKAKAPQSLILVGTAYSYLQEFLPHVAQAVVRQGWVDSIGLGRVTLSYPRILADATQHGAITQKSICRTFSDCTTAPRNGLVSGCYPLDPYYLSTPEAEALKALKKASPAPTPPS